MKDVHTEHCCSRHGCKYGNPDCTVTTGKAPQSYPCEYCAMDEESGVSSLMDQIESQARTIEELRIALERSLSWNDAWLEPKNVQYWSPDQYDACVEEMVSVRTALSKAKQS